MLKIQLSLDSLVLNEPIEINIALPQPLSFKKQSFKNIWCLHGAISDGNLFFERLNLLDLVDNGYVVICPSLSNSFYLNSFNRNVADFLDLELYPYLLDLLPLSSLRENNICLGLSMGAYGALNWSIRRSSYFYRVFLLSGFYDYRLPVDFRIKNQRETKILASILFPYMKTACEEDNSIKFSADILKQLEIIDSSSLSFFPKFDFICGDHDYLSLNQTEYFFNIISNKGIPSTLRIIENGMHDIKTWRKFISELPTILKEPLL